MESNRLLNGQPYQQADQLDPEEQPGGWESEGPRQGDFLK